MVESGGPEGFRADLVGELVDGCAELFKPAPSFVEYCFAAVLGLVKERGLAVMAALLRVAGRALIARRGVVGVRHVCCEL